MRFIFIVLFLVSFGSVGMGIVFPPSKITWSGAVGDVYFCNQIVHTTHMMEQKNMAPMELVTAKFKISEKSVSLKVKGWKNTEDIYYLPIQSMSRSRIVAVKIQKDVVFAMVFRFPVEPPGQLKFSTTGIIVSNFFFAECTKF